MHDLLIRKIIVTHKERFFRKRKLIEREVLNDFEKFIKGKEIVFISGIRRCGKSTLLTLIANKLIKENKVRKANILFINFEDERFINFNVEDFDKLYTNYLQIENPKGKKYLFFDEIQNIKGWERWINRTYEFEDVKIFLTGSNATLASSEISVSLTGRNRQINLMPFSFREFLSAVNIQFSTREIFLPEKISLIKRKFEEYLNLGGFPEIIKNKDVSLAEQYYKDIIFRDIVSQYGIRNIQELRELSLYLISNTGTIISYEQLRKVLQINNTTTVKNYLNIFQDVFLFHSIPKYDFSVKKQIYNPDKYYISDLGFYHAIGFKFSENAGKILENFVFEELKRRKLEIYYWKSKKNKEVDFIVKEKNSLSLALQVTFLLNRENMNREIGSLICAAEELGIKKLLVLTNDQEEKIKEESFEISVLPVWKWALNLS